MVTTALNVISALLWCATDDERPRSLVGLNIATGSSFLPATCPAPVALPRPARQCTRVYASAPSYMCIRPKPCPRRFQMAVQGRTARRKSAPSGRRVELDSTRSKRSVYVSRFNIFKETNLTS